MMKLNKHFLIEYVKSSFKCFKNWKINFIQAILKLETFLYQNIFKSFYHILYIYRHLDINNPKSVLREKKPYEYHFVVYKRLGFGDVRINESKRLMVFVTQKKKISYQKFNKKKLGSSHKVTLFISKKSGMINKFIHKIKTVFFLKFHT